MFDVCPIEFALRVPIIEKAGAKWLVDTGCPCTYPSIRLPQNAMARHKIPGLRLLGLDSFRRYTKIDYANREIVFSDEPIELDGSTIHMSSVAKCWKVLMTVDGRNHDYIIDTGAAYSYVHDLSTGQLKAEQIEDSGLSGRVWNATVRHTSASFQGRDFDILCADAHDNMEAGVPSKAVPTEGVIGYEFFANFVVVVDRVEGNMIFKYSS